MRLRIATCFYFPPRDFTGNFVGIIRRSNARTESKGRNAWKWIQSVHLGIIPDLSKGISLSLSLSVWLEGMRFEDCTREEIKARSERFRLSFSGGHKYVMIELSWFHFHRETHTSFSSLKAFENNSIRVFNIKVSTIKRNCKIVWNTIPLRVEYVIKLYIL